MFTSEQSFGNADFDLLCQQALDNERLRLHRNIHADHAEPCQRLFIAMQPGSYVAPHRHTAPAKSETFIALQGCLGLLFFDDLGRVRNKVEIGPDRTYRLCDIPAGVWHTAVALESDSVFLEVKPGPYCPVSAVDWASWAPTSGSREAPDYLAFLYSQFNRESPPLSFELP